MYSDAKIIGTIKKNDQQREKKAPGEIQVLVIYLVNPATRVSEIMGKIIIRLCFFNPINRINKMKTCNNKVYQS